MKHIVFLGDGMADEPIPELGGRTPLEAANTPSMDRIAAAGRSGRFLSLPEGVSTSSDVANLSVLGYDPRQFYPGRGPVEAAAQGVRLEPGEVAFRCNLVTVNDADTLLDFAAGRPTDQEAEELVDCLARELGGEQVDFIRGLSYRHLLRLRRGDWSTAVRCEKPDDHQGDPCEPNLPTAREPEGAATAALLVDLIRRSRPVLEASPANRARAAAGRPLANMIWPYGGGGASDLPSFESRYGVRGAVVAGVDVIFGIGELTGMTCVHVDGATGYLDTNFEGKADAGLAALADHNLVYIHVEAADECSHQADLAGKLRAIEDFDRRLMARVMAGAPADTRFMILPDHPVPLASRRHTRTPVPFAVCGPGIEPDAVETYGENTAGDGACGLLQSDELMRLLIVPAGTCAGPDLPRSP